MQTNEGYFQLIDGLSIGSSLRSALRLANGWLSKFEPKIREEAKLHSCYMDDIVRNIYRSNVENKLHQIYYIHLVLKFAIEKYNKNLLL